MKSPVFALLLAAVIPCATMAATTLIDPALHNGGFETRTAATYADGSDWFNYGAAPETTAVYGSTKYAGTYGGTVSLASNPSVATGWAVASGDVYNLNFYGYSTNVSLLAATPIVWSLYYYSTESDVGFDKTTATSGVTLFSGNVTNTAITANSTWTSVSSTALDTLSLDGTALANAAGKTLYLRFYRTAGDGTFPVIDNVTLTATAVPEPSAYGLLGAGTLAAFAGLRRRRSAR